MGLGQNLAAYESPAVSRHGDRAPADGDFRTLVGSSPAMRTAVELARRAAIHPAANVLLAGEPGTGKELFARAIHCASSTSGEPFVVISCAAMPESLLESELFGHERGAIADTRTSKRGLLEVAGRGTVLLDEIDQLPLSLQPKLLRALEERRVRRLGAIHEYEVHCRILVATHRDLRQAVEAGTLRSDLYYRLNVFRIDVPPLRERDGDLEPLAQHFLNEICRDHGLPGRFLSLESHQLLGGYAWPGNVRELKNTLETAVVMCDGDTIRPHHIRLQGRRTVSEPGELPDAVTPNGGDASSPAALQLPAHGITLEEMERMLILETLRRAGGNRSLAARMLGVSRPTVIRKIQRYHLV